RHGRGQPGPLPERLRHRGQARVLSVYGKGRRRKDVRNRRAWRVWRSEVDGRAPPVSRRRPARIDSRVFESVANAKVPFIGSTPKREDHAESYSTERKGFGVFPERVGLGRCSHSFSPRRKARKEK